MKRWPHSMTGATNSPAAPSASRQRTMKRSMHLRVIIDDPEASGGRYAIVPNGTGDGYRPEQDPQALQYNFQIESPGQYRFYVLSQGPTGNEDSIWVSMDDGRLFNGGSKQANIGLGRMLQPCLHSLSLPANTRCASATGKMASRSMPCCWCPSRLPTHSRLPKAGMLFCRR